MNKLLYKIKKTISILVCCALLFIGNVSTANALGVYTKVGAAIGAAIGFCYSVKEYFLSNNNTSKSDKKEEKPNLNGNSKNVINEEKN